MKENKGKTAFDNILNAKLGEDQQIELALVILDDDVILPYTITPLPRDGINAENMTAISEALDTHKTLIYGYQKTNPIDKNTPLLEQIEPYGTEFALIDLTEDNAQLSMMMVQGRRRVQITELVQEHPARIVRARIIEDHITDFEKANQYREDILQIFEEISERNEYIPDDIIDYLYELESDAEFVDTFAALLSLSTEERLTLLRENQVEARYSIIMEHLKRELGAMDILEDVHDQVQDEMERVQREMYLREQMRVIQQELGEGDIFEQELNELRMRLSEVHLPEEAHKQAMRELSRLAIMPPMSPESSVIRTYLDWIIDLPWHTASKDNLNLRHAEKVLNSAHYGLEKVKERVLEHIAVRKLAGNKMRTPILCFVGPPGVGKTSLGKSIADALGREFIRVSLGGVRDEAEIRGHRRTYIGALPGRIINTIKRTGTVNPVFMLDEIDKLSEDYRGDPAAALLEVLDPEQNHEFVDHYLEIPYDLSKVLFIATANALYPLPEALEDRMEIIEFRAYTEEEKLEIAKRFLIPKQTKAHGLERRRIKFLENSLVHIIRHYTLEAGVRNLEREIANVCRKITRLAAMRKKYPKRITPSLIEKYLGPPYLIDPLVNREDRIGLVTGLVWTSGGGDVQIIEVALLPGKGNLTLTGQLGEVLQESAQIALNYMRWCADEMDVPHDDFENYDIHIHMPEGAVPKDGPSAGITLATAIISVFTERKVSSDWAMTGEMTLRGHVLSVGGVKEKLLAARRRGIMKIILPADNEKDLIDIPKNALKNMDVRFVRDMSEVIDIILLPAPEQRQRDEDGIEEDEIEDEGGMDSEDADN